MSIKKYSNGAWSEVGYKKYGTETDTITTLPKTIIGDGQSASAVIKGNMQQTGTPTPTNPIYPTECGDKTANLFSQTLSSMNINSVGQIVTDASKDLFIAEVNEGERYTISNLINTQVIGYFTAKPELGTTTYNNSRDIVSLSSATVTIPRNNNIKYIAVRYNTSTTNAMLNSGSTALPFEPFGYKIPISSANTTTPVYLGEVQSVRNIAKYVFTGQETWVKSSQAFYTDIIDSLAKSNTLPVCSHFNSSYSDGICVTTGNKRLKLFESALPTGITTAAEVQQYMLTQYDNGTPVCIWYVLATPTTGIVNEPIRKIGDYADSVTETGLPTTGTAEQFDVYTTLKPSEVSLTYHGWHEHSDTVFTTE